MPRLNLHPARCIPALLLLTACNRSTLPDYPAGYREFAYVANSGSNTVSVLDLVYLRTDRTVRVGTHPVALAASPTRNEVYVVNQQPAESAGSLSILDAASNTVAATIALHRDPVALAVAPSGQRAYIANRGSNTITVIDLDQRRALASFPTGQHPAALALAPDERTLVVTNQADGSISLFAVERSRSPALHLRATFPGCPGADSPVILPDSSKAFVACSASHQVLALALAAAPDSWAARQDAAALADHTLALLDVGRSPTHLTLKPDGGEVFVSNRDSDTVSEISTQTNEVGSTYAIGNRPTHGLVSADNAALWVANEGADSLSLYSIDDGKLVSSLRTGAAPNALAFSADPKQTFLLAADRRSGDVAVIRTASKLGPALLTLLPAGQDPTAIVVKAIAAKP